MANKQDNCPLRGKIIAIKGSMLSLYMRKSGPCLIKPFGFTIQSKPHSILKFVMIVNLIIFENIFEGGELAS